MGKRVAALADSDYVTPTSAGRAIRKRKRPSSTATKAKLLRLSAASNGSCHTEQPTEQEDDANDEDSSSNDAATTLPVQNHSNKQANNSSILRNTSLNDTLLMESPKPVYTLHPSLVNGTILYDLMQKPWRLGRPIGKGNFGEIFLASDNITEPVRNENAQYVVKIEPHSNGPLFVEIHCLMNTAKKEANLESESGIYGATKRTTSTTSVPHSPPSGIPDYIASGSHCFGDARYRFLVLQRYDSDLHSLIKNSRVEQKSVLTLAIQIVDVLERLHDKGYCHNDVKAQNLMISKCKYYPKRQESTASSSASTASSCGASTNGTRIQKAQKYDYEEKQQTTDSGNSSEQEGHEDDGANEDFAIRRYTHTDDDVDEDFDDYATSNNSNSLDMYQTPLTKNRRIGRLRSNVTNVEYSGSNPVRSCRRQKSSRNPVYEEMVKSHYLRPTKRISYSEFFNEDGVAVENQKSVKDCQVCSSDNESEEFVPHLAQRSAKKSTVKRSIIKRMTRRQEKLALALASTATTTTTTANQQLAQHMPRASATQPVAAVEEERIFLIDFGLASKFADNGAHRPFVMDQRRAHDGTLEFTSRDAHMGAHSRRSDLECLGYNLIYWSQGYLPWKEAATLQQQEKVHRAKEYLMTDVREMLAQIYGKQVPKYLGEFLHKVGELAYHDRPDYALYRRIFEREYQQLGRARADIRLDSREIKRTCVRFKEEIENKNDLFEMCKPNGSNNVLSIMKNLSVGTPFHERTLSNRVSPKNLRSKSATKKTKKKKFSWAEILSQDPDQIARERAEKEFDREEESCDVQQPIVRKYEGFPTYAILEIERRRQLVQDDVKYETPATAAISSAIAAVRKTTDESDSDSDVEKESEKDEQENDNNKEEDVEMAKWDSCDAGENDEEVNENTDQQAHKGSEEDSGKSEEETETDETEETVGSERGRRIVKRRRTSANAVGASTKKSGIKTTIAGVQRKSTGRRKRTSATAATTTAAATKSTKSQPAATEMTKTKTRKTTTSALQASYKRGSAKRLGSGRLTSATGEIADQHQHGPLACGGGGGAKPSERRTRRCVIKTVEPKLEHEEGEEHSGSFSPDMHSLFNVWNRISKGPPIYLRTARK